LALCSTKRFERGQQPGRAGRRRRRSRAGRRDWFPWGSGLSPCHQDSPSAGRYALQPASPHLQCCRMTRRPARRRGMPS